MSKNPKFDRAQVIEKATNLYWEKGFYATSMRNLQDAIDMRPGSIYAAFGSKDGVFKEALAHYSHMGIESLREHRRLSDSPIGALKSFIKSVVIEASKDAPSCMCMLAKTVAELNDDQAELLLVAKQSLKLIEKEFAATIQAAQDIGEVDKNKNALELAGIVQVQLMGLRLYAKANDGAQLEKMIDAMFLRELA